MTEHVINGHKVADGQMVHYVARNGERREALIKLLHPVIFYADIQTKDDEGNPIFLERVPFSEAGVHSWDHIPEDILAEMQKGNEPTHRRTK